MPLMINDSRIYTRRLINNGYFKNFNYLHVGDVLFSKIHFHKGLAISFFGSIPCHEFVWLLRFIICGQIYLMFQTKCIENLELPNIVSSQESVYLLSRNRKHRINQRRYSPVPAQASLETNNINEKENQDQ
jgi:hypothetical protein